jgi:flavin-binding protein dodecin
MVVYKTIDIVATSDKDWGDAVKHGFETVKKTLKGVRNMETVTLDVKVKEDEDKLIYRVRLRVHFELEKS